MNEGKSIIERTKNRLIEKLPGYTIEELSGVVKELISKNDSVQESGSVLISAILLARTDLLEQSADFLRRELYKHEKSM